MRGRHRGLIVEDDSPTATDLEDVVSALGWDSVVVDNKADALAELKQGAFCFALFDLQIKVDRDSLRGTVGAGQELVRETRRLYPQHTGAPGSYRLPILVVSGHARETDHAVAVMRDGADDLIQKPLDIRAVSEAIRQALARAGRADHVACAATPRPSPTGNLHTISFPGEKVRRRTVVLVDGKRARLTDGMLKIFLRLVVANQSGGSVHKIDLGANPDQGFKRISELSKELESALGEGVKIIENDYQGHYAISGTIVLGDSDFDHLIAMADATITRLVEQLRQHRDRKV